MSFLKSISSVFSQVVKPIFLSENEALYYDNSHPQIGDVVLKDGVRYTVMSVELSEVGYLVFLSENKTIVTANLRGRSFRVPVVSKNGVLWPPNDSLVFRSGKLILSFLVSFCDQCFFSLKCDYGRHVLFYKILPYLHVF